MSRKKIARIILSKVLEMPLERYIKYIDTKISTGYTKLGNISADKKNKLLYARVIQHNGKLTFEISDPCLANNIQITHQKTNDNRVVALKWINTRNIFSKHILQSLLNYQSEFWHSGKEIDLKPLTLKLFLFLYPLEYLDQSRISRLLPTLLVKTPHGKVINLRTLFPSKKRCCAYQIEKIINNRQEMLRDEDIQTALARNGFYISRRSICNYRKILGIPSYKQRLSHCYGKDIRFSDYIKLAKGQYNKIPFEPGVYELSSAKKIHYVNCLSSILYIGASKNIRKRLMSYCGTNGKNEVLKEFTKGSDIFVRYCLTENYLQLEKHLLRCFNKTYGRLPKANKLGE